LKTGSEPLVFKKKDFWCTRAARKRVLGAVRSFWRESTIKAQIPILLPFLSQGIMREPWSILGLEKQMSQVIANLKKR
jgi:hypothetical protein